MIATKHPLLYILIVIGIIATIIVTLFVTHNPLAILGLYFIPQVPVLPNMDHMPLDAYGDDDEDDGGAIGFTAQLKK